MDCPQCHNSEINSSGICLVCGYQMEESPEIVEKVNDEPPAQNNELPRWRQELSERLQAIKQKKETVDKAEAPVISSASVIDKPRRLSNTAPKSKQAAAVSSVPGPPAPQQKVLVPVANPEEIEKIIDKAVSRQSSQSPEESSAISTKFQSAFYEDKLILLSRTLTGLVDLMIVVLCTGIFIIASDYCSGIITLDFISFLVYSGLFLLTYFVYSMFFLTASTQTIGMMITDLRVVSKDGSRPRFLQVFTRCCSFLASLFVLGIGLIWSLFDSENRCLHDRLSGTQVVRL